ncbi:cell wall hydrolase [Hafnia alvei]|uniref:cell wall hydrolase n=1 Tax=Hafnia alvei TaxID=569 RepID=UPI000B6BEA7F|nr:cell wall hydrolase [Hafnia alvei]MBI0275452.1 cell wall hydrolase [Hafnia alvei]PNK98552.1 hypothetical protein CEQ28_013640 [Hafnia alvei]
MKKSLLIIMCFFFSLSCYAKNISNIGGFSSSLTSVVDSGKKILATYGTNLYLQGELNLYKIPKNERHNFNCMMHNIFFEARGEDIYGKRMVADVVINRVMNSAYPNSICKTIYQHHQFSWANGRKSGLSRAQRGTIASIKAMARGKTWTQHNAAYRPYNGLAQSVWVALYRVEMGGEAITRATSYYAPQGVASAPVWARSHDLLYIGKHGKHVFYMLANNREE